MVMFICTYLPSFLEMYRISFLNVFLTVQPPLFTFHCQAAILPPVTQQAALSY